MFSPYSLFTVLLNKDITKCEKYFILRNAIFENIASLSVCSYITQKLQKGFGRNFGSVFLGPLG